MTHPRSVWFRTEHPHCSTAGERGSEERIVFLLEMDPECLLHLARIGDHEHLMTALGKAAYGPVRLCADAALDWRVLANKTDSHVTLWSSGLTSCGRLSQCLPAAWITWVEKYPASWRGYPFSGSRSGA